MYTTVINGDDVIDGPTAPKKVCRFATQASRFQSTPVETTVMVGVVQLGTPRTTMQEAGETASAHDRDAPTSVLGINADAIVQTNETIDKALLRALHAQYEQMRNNFDEVRATTAHRATRCTSSCTQFKRWHEQLSRESQYRMEHVVEQLSIKVRKHFVQSGGILITCV